MIFKLKSDFCKAEYASLLNSISESGIDETFETTICRNKKVMIIFSLYKGKNYLKMQIFEKAKGKYVLCSFSEDEPIDKNLKSVALSAMNGNDTYEYRLTVR